MADIGYISLLLALLASVYSAIAIVIGKKRGAPALIDSARNGILVVLALVSISVVALAYSLITRDFQIDYVASHASTTMSLPYLISALWAGDEGSLLLWAWLLSIFGAVVMLRKRDVGYELVPYATTIIMITGAFFLFLLLRFDANPFVKSIAARGYVPTEGPGLNPLLENPGMLFHPPALLYGYVGFTVPFAFAIAALLTKRLGDEWIVAIRKWTLVAWLVLGMGNLIGAWWAYVELGWGGYWGWDPVENASLMPWLVGTAFLHSINMQRRRGILKVWNLVLIILTFSLAIFGMFLNRTDILSSVHAFPNNTLGPFFLVFVGVILFGSLGLLYYRSDWLKSEAEMESIVSRESTFLINNLLLVLATFAVFLGTVFPVISEAIGGVQITLKASWFNQVVGPIFLTIILLAGICALIGWRRTSVSNLKRSFLWPLAGALIVGLAIGFGGARQPYALLAFFLCSFVLFTILYEWFRGTRARHKMRSENYLKAFFGLIGANRPRYGGYIVHIGVVLMAIGVIASSFYSVSKDLVTLKPGESVSIKNYTLTYEGRTSSKIASKQVASATLSVSKGGKALGNLVPVTFYDENWGMQATDVAIRATLLEDLYIIPEVVWDNANARWDWDYAGEATTFKIIVNPLVDWIWIGGVVLFLGAMISLWPQKQSLPEQNNDDSEEGAKKGVDRRVQQKGQPARKSRARSGGATRGGR